MALSASYLQFNEVRTMSQYYSITDQLNLGVRHIELDVHFFHGQLRISHCGFSVGVINYLFYFMEKMFQWFNFHYDTETIGCLPSFNGIPSEDQLLLRPVLEEIATWLNLPRNRDEIVIIYLDTSSNLIRWNKVDDLIMEFVSVLDSLLILPFDELNLQKLIAVNKRVMVVSRRVFPGGDSLFFYTNTPQTCQYPLWQEYDIDNVCYSNGEVRTDLKDFLTYSRVVTNQLRYGPLSKDFLPIASPVNIYANNIRGLYELGVNTLATDYIDEEQMKSHIWTWSPSLNISQLHEEIKELCVAVDTGSGRWTVTLCKETHRILCRSAVNKTDFIIGGYLSHPQLSIPRLHNVSYTEEATISLNPCPFGYVFIPPISA
ncbi:hypothetical protein JH06_2226 [Blastocystis sp. subtype 4]|uniref:hypothetical protein n=1 Tax=Blastocystis sp. subtype 4 TaxID=944170 RepID=UPI00071155C7|nr:hypothetical protein JH06_2226 [Blastocystis sp. subtype 4]KNB43840.1 hypothetical protein JH06_2226 [Blastocystis sp. subtype 4]|eukprot:XP_014527283.1 hypothetical protein JH06_2226 [Blastocystis sp. subtype 4]